MLVLAKQHIYECRNKCTYPSFTIFLNKVSYVHQLEKKLMNSNNKVADLISYFIVVIVPKQSLYQPLFMYSRKCILCTCSSILLV